MAGSVRNGTRRSGSERRPTTSHERPRTSQGTALPPPPPPPPTTTTSTPSGTRRDSLRSSNETYPSRSASNSSETYAARSAPPPAPEPRFLYRVTDDSSLVKIDDYGNFDTHCHLFKTMDPDISSWALWNHLERSQQQSETKGRDSPMFLYVTSDVEWARAEFERRMHGGKRNVQVHGIDTRGFVRSRLQLQKDHCIDVLKHPQSGATFFSASVEAGRENEDVEANAEGKNREAKGSERERPVKDAREWFALEFIPAASLELLVHQP